MAMLPAWGGQRQKDKTAKNRPYNTNNTKFTGNFLEVLVSPPCLGLILLDLQAVQSCYCPTQPFHKAYRALAAA